MATATTQQKISSLYIAFFDRAGDKAGFDMWVDKLGKGGTLTDIADGFVGHEMFSTKYKGMSDEDFVKAIYKNILGKDGDAEGIANHTKWLGDGTYSSKADFVAKFCESSLTIELTAEKFPNLSADELKAAQARQDLLQNKTKAAVDFVEKLGTQTDIPSGVDAGSATALLANAEFAASQKAINFVTEDPASLTLAKSLNETLAKSDKAISNLNKMKAITAEEIAVLKATIEDKTTGDFNLTSESDTIVGTSGDDIIKGSIGTWGSKDSIKDASTTDNDEFQVEINTGISSTVVVENIEKVSIETFTNQDVNGITITGAKEINNANSTGVLTINNADTSVDYVMTSAVGGLALHFDEGSTGGANDSVNVSLNGVTNGTLEIGAANGGNASGIVETVILDLDKDATLLDLIETRAINTLQIKGDHVFILNSNANIANVGTIEARKAGAVSFAVDLAAAGTAILTGSGDDGIAIEDTITANDVFSLGLGNDTLITKTAGTGKAAVYQGVDNIISGVANDNFDMAKSDQATVFNMNGGGTVTAANMYKDSTVTIKSTADTGNTTLGFGDGVKEQAFTADIQSVINGDLTVTNVADLTISLNGVTGASTLNTITLDDTNDTTGSTAKLTMDVNTTLNNVVASNFANTDNITDFTVNANGKTALGTFGEATKLTNLTLNATKGAIAIGTIGNTNNSTLLDKVEIKATAGTIDIGDVTANNANGITSITVDASGGNVDANGATTPAATTFNNTGGNIGTVTIAGSYNVTQNYTAGKGNVNVVDAATGGTEGGGTGLTGALKTTITNAATANADGTTTGSTVTLGNVVSGSTNTVTMAGTDVANTITGGTGVDDITSVGGKDTIDGGAGDDKIDGGGNADTLTGGAGADTFEFKAAADNGTGALLGADTTAALLAASHDVITDYSGKSRGNNDVIDETAAAITIETNDTAAAGKAKIDANGLASFDASDNTLAEQITAVEAAINASTNTATTHNAGDAAVWVNGNNTYLFISDGTAGVGANDIIVELTGISASTGITIAADGNITDIA